MLEISASYRHDSGLHKELSEAEAVKLWGFHWLNYHHLLAQLLAKTELE